MMYQNEISKEEVDALELMGKQKGIKYNITT